MASCETEKWSLEKLSKALINETADGKEIVVPMFQRGKRWTIEQEKTFIDSLKKGYPIGTMLFYKRIEESKEVYLLIDGLQRSNTIRRYMENPTQFFYVSNITDDACDKILSFIGCSQKEMYQIVREELDSFIKKQKTFKNVQYAEVAENILERCKVKGVKPSQLAKIIINEIFEDKQMEYDKISNMTVPVIVYSGDEKTLPEIFARINSKGTPLDQYEIYAASWPVDKKFKINNDDILNYVIKKYETLINEGYSIHGFSKEKMMSTKKVNAFEYLFGLGKYLSDEWDGLRFKKKQETDDMVNPIAFELVNACLNDTDKINSLYKKINCININLFENALQDAINFVMQSISAITNFKGNKHKENKNAIFHSKFQILSMISTTFKEMYRNGDYSSFDIEWNKKKKILAKNMQQYYVYDIITNYWSEGGTSKIHSAAKPNRYLQAITGRAWSIALDNFFENSMQRTESKSIANPKSEEYVLLNCIYLQTFSAMDQLSDRKFDVEHIAPKEQMKSLIKDCNGDGLPISCIANLCYLPEFDNRSKGKNTFYQDKKYLDKVDIKEIESKYSFTVKSDLEWIDLEYTNKEDFDVLKDEFISFLTKRFQILKQKIFESLKIEHTDCSHQNDEDMVYDKKNEWINILNDYNYTGKKIIAIKIDDKQIKTKNTTSAYCIMHKLLYTKYKSLYANSDFSWFCTDDNLRKPYMIEKNAYIEKNKNNNEKIKTIKDVLYNINQNAPTIAVQIESNDDFDDLPKDIERIDIKKESSHREITVGKLAYLIFKNIIENGLISDKEIMMLMTKDYSHAIFHSTHYPVLADNVNAYKGNGSTKRYRNTPIRYKGKDLYITTQWYENSRDDLIKWYHKHK